MSCYVAPSVSAMPPQALGTRLRVIRTWSLRVRAVRRLHFASYACPVLPISPAWGPYDGRWPERIDHALPRQRVQIDQCALRPSRSHCSGLERATRARRRCACAYCIVPGTNISGKSRAMRTLRRPLSNTHVLRDNVSNWFISGPPITPLADENLEPLKSNPGLSSRSPDRRERFLALIALLTLGVPYEPRQESLVLRSAGVGDVRADGALAGRVRRIRAAASARSSSSSWKVGRLLER